MQTLRFGKLEVSPLGVMKLDTCCSLHHIAELSQLCGPVTSTWSEVALLSSFILGVSLRTETWANVIGLISIWPSSLNSVSTCFGQSPSWKVSVNRSMSWCFWDIPTWTNRVWRRCHNFQSIIRFSISSISKGIFFRVLVNGLLSWSILWTWICFSRARLESGLSSDLGCPNPWLSVDIGLDRVIKEKSILIEIVLRFVLTNSDLCAHRPARHLQIEFELRKTERYLLTLSYFTESWYM